MKSDEVVCLNTLPPIVSPHICTSLLDWYLEETLTLASFPVQCNFETKNYKDESKAGDIPRYSVASPARQLQTKS